MKTWPNHASHSGDSAMIRANTRLKILTPLEEAMPMHESGSARMKRGSILILFYFSIQAGAGQLTFIFLVLCFAF